MVRNSADLKVQQKLHTYYNTDILKSLVPLSIGLTGTFWTLIQKSTRMVPTFLRFFSSNGEHFL